MDMLALLNSAINFILYCSMSRQFRNTFKSLFLSYFIHRNNLTNDVTGSICNRNEFNGGSTQITQV